jgi:hypothetical protein
MIWGCDGGVDERITLFRLGRLLTLDRLGFEDCPSNLTGPGGHFGSRWPISLSLAHSFPEIAALEALEGGDPDMPVVSTKNDQHRESTIQ